MNNKRNSTIQTPNQSVYEYVDLGLPSGTLWATENIKDVNGNELYFAWGETAGYTAKQVRNWKYTFSWCDYKFGLSLTKYNKSDHLKVLEPKDDAATQNWGAGWKIPTSEQFTELMEGTTHEWTEINGINGLLCTSKANGNTLFLPAVGGVRDGDVGGVGVFGDYWADSLNDVNAGSAWNFSFFNGIHGMSTDSRCCGYSVRPIRFQNE